MMSAAGIFFVNDPFQIKEIPFYSYLTRFVVAAFRNKCILSNAIFSFIKIILYFTFKLLTISYIDFCSDKSLLKNSDQSVVFSVMSPAGFNNKVMLVLYTKLRHIPFHFEDEDLCRIDIIICLIELITGIM